MSRRGTGYVAVDTSSTTSTGAVIGTALGAASGVAAGAGVMVLQGIMWCGEKLQQNYINACNEWTERVEQARAENLSRVSNLPDFMTQCLEQAAINSANLSIESSAVITPGRESSNATGREVAAALARARAALNTGQELATIRVANERELWQQRLRMELMACRGLLPAAQISAAEAVLQQGTVTQLQQTLASLQQAASILRDEQLRHQHAQRMAVQAVQATAQQLQAFAVLLQNSGNTSLYTQEMQTFTTQLEYARNEASSSPAQALSQANSIQSQVRQLMQTVSDTLLRNWEASRLQIVTTQGMLDSLSTILQESASLKVVETVQLQPLMQRVADAQKDANNLLHATTPDLPQRLRLLVERAKMLKDDVFRVTTSGQQKQIAQTIATTLAEQGFHAPDGQTATVQPIGNSVQIATMSIRTTPEGGRDDRMVTFVVSHDGEVTYDFSGYVGEACKPDIERVFKALRDKGIFLLDSRALQEIQQLPPHQITPATLRQPRFSPENTPNKAQAEIAQRFLNVLKQMGYHNIRQNTIGGYIDLEGFNGTIGYHVTLPPDGSAQVFRDQQEVTNDAHDPLAAEAQHTSQSNEAATVQQEQQKIHETLRKPVIKPRRQQMLGQ